MGARSGNNYLSTLKKLGAEIWIGGERVREATSHPAFRNCAHSIASLYDMQMERPEAMTFRTEDGGRAGMSFIQPKTAEEVRKRGLMMKAWADFSGGFLAHTPDYLNVSIAAMAAAHSFFADSDARYGNNIQNYYRQARNFDWCATHALVDPPASDNPELALKLVERANEGIVVNGCRMLAGLAPMSEELLVLPSAPLKVEASAKPSALSFAVPCNTKGLRFICRDTYADGQSKFDHPLSARFDEMECIAIFDQVMVPWERVFLCGDVERCNALLAATSARLHMMHQAVVRTVAKSEFMLGLAARIAESGQAMPSQHPRDRLAEMITATETMRACLRAAEADATSDNRGVFAPARAPLATARSIFPKLYPRMVEMIQLAGSSSLMAMPAGADFANAEMRPELDRYLASGGADAHERVALYRLAWDAACSSFAGKQVLLERFSSGDAAQMGNALIDDINLQPLLERVKAFLARPE